jgi:hypothetical protein
MKKGYKIFALIFLSLLISSIFINFVAAAPSNTPLSDAIGNFFSSIQKVSLDESNKASLSRVLLILLVVMFVYSISSFIPLLEDSPFIQFSISVIIGILSFLYVSAEDIRLILTNYEALGVALTSIIPLLIILVFTFQLRRKSASVATFVNPLIIILFASYSLYKWFTVSPTSDLKLLYLFSLILAAIWFFVGSWLSFKIEQMIGKGRINEYKFLSKLKIQAEINRLEDSKQYLTKGQMVAVQTRIDELKKLLRKK